MLTRKGKEKISSFEFMSKKSLNQISNFSSFLQSVTPIAPLKPLSEVIHYFFKVFFFLG